MEIKKALSEQNTSISFIQQLKLNLISLLCNLISILLSPVVLLTLLLFYVYKQIIQLYLKWKLGSDFKGMLEGVDALWAIEDISKSIINQLVLVEVDNFAEIQRHTNSIAEIIISQPEFSKSIYFKEKTCGYYYWKKVDFDIQNYVKYVDFGKNGENDLTKDELIKALSEKCNATLPQNHRTLVEILVGTKRIETCFPVLIRIHHSVGDGTALAKLFLNAIKKPDKFKFKNFKNDELCTYTNSLEIKLKFLLKIIYLSIICPGNLMKLFWFGMPSEKSILYGPKLTGRKLISWYSDDENGTLLQKIKEIQSRLNGTTFTHIILTGLSECIYTHLKKNSNTFPDTFNFMLTVQRSNAQTRDITSNPLTNSFFVQFGSLPTSLKLTETNKKINPLLNRLNEIKKQTENMKTGTSEKSFYWVTSVLCQVLPEILAKHFIRQPCGTASLTNVPGPPELLTYENCLIKDIIFWSPHKYKTGLGFSVFTYGQRLFLGIIADEAVVPNIEHIQDLLNCWTACIEQLHKVVS